MEQSIEQEQTHSKGSEGVALSVPCAMLAEKANLPARCEAQALPNSFVPGYSIQTTVDRIRNQHSNYEQLLSELSLPCMEKGPAGGRCVLSQNVALVAGWRRCPLLSLLKCDLRRVADEKAEEAFSAWRRRKDRQRRDH